MEKKQYIEPLVEMVRFNTQEMMIIEGGTTGVLPPKPGPSSAPARRTEVF